MTHMLKTMFPLFAYSLIFTNFAPAMKRSILYASGITPP